MSDFLKNMAIGDAFGMKYEFVLHDTDADQSSLIYGPHPVYTAYKCGNYTDDTQMSLANTRVLLHTQDLNRVTEQDFVRSWIDAYIADPREGYSKTMQAALKTATGPADFCSKFDPSQGTTSGAAMRAAPFGLISDPQMLVHLVTMQGRVTHDTPDALNAALAVALSVHYLYHGGKKENLPLFLKNFITADLDDSAAIIAKGPKNALSIVTHALDAVLQATSYSEVLLACVNLKNYSDTDTVCAMAMAVASFDRTMARDLPAALLTDHNPAPYGFDMLEECGKKLTRKFPAKNIYGPVLRNTGPTPL